MFKTFSTVGAPFILPLAALHKNASIIREAGELLALHKPIRILSHPNSESDRAKSLLTCDYCNSTESYEHLGKRVYLLHRLDESTSGIILTSTDAVLAKSIKQLFADRLVSKVYHALVFGHVKYGTSLWTDELPGKRIAITEVKPIRRYQSFPPTTLLELHPKTGYTHQLRIQSARRSHYIVGDRVHGDFDLNKEFTLRLPEPGLKRLFLHAHKISLRYVHKGVECVFEAEDPMPSCFRSIERLDGVLQ